MFSTGITAIFTAIAECAKSVTANIENKATLAVVKEDTKQDRAIIAANKAFDLILYHIHLLPKSAQKTFLRYKKTFDRNIT